MLANPKKPDADSGLNKDAPAEEQSQLSSPADMWGSLLSRQAPLIRSIYFSLDPASRKVVLNHLQLMATQPGWQPQQIQSAKVALEVLGTEPAP
jgi:hypothetical protein